MKSVVVLSIYIMTNFKLKLITPKGVVYEGEIIEASLPTPDGQLTILANHMPLMTLISPGEILLHGAGKEHYLSTEGGIAYVSKNFLKILADTAESADSLDEAKIEEARKRAANILSNTTDEVEFAHAEALLEKQLAKLRFVKKRRNKQ